MKPESLTRRIDPRPGRSSSAISEASGLDRSASSQARCFWTAARSARFGTPHQTGAFARSGRRGRTGHHRHARAHRPHVIEVVGDAAHAGPDRARVPGQDAVAASAEVVHRMNARGGRALGGRETIWSSPSASSRRPDAVFNKIAGDVRLSFEARSLEVEVRKPPPEASRHLPGMWKAETSVSLPASSLAP